MRKFLSFVISMELFMMIFTPMSIFSQVWTEPVNVSNMAGLDGFNQMPDFCFDQNGVFHCIWVHVYEVNFSKVFYSKSFDEGMTWTTAEDVSLNTAKRISEPHIVCDTNNQLHLCYDFDTGNTYETLVYYKTLTETGWSTPDTISFNMPGSYHNRLAIDHNNRLYCFWFHNLNNGSICYSYLDDNGWSEIIIPYNNNDLHFLQKAIVDSNNNLYCAGIHHFEGQSGYDDRAIYFSNINGNWSDIIQLSDNTTWNGLDIDLSNNYFPAVVWRQYTSNTYPPNDGTLYSYFDGMSWTTPEIIVEDPIEQQIIVDENNSTNIFDVEKTDEGSMLVHYFKKEGTWEGFIIDESEWYGMTPKTQNHERELYTFYIKPVTGNISEIFFSKSDIISEVKKEEGLTLDLTVYPNPFTYMVSVAFKIVKPGRTQINIYTINGVLINKLLDETKPPGAYKTIWNGNDQNENAVKPGIYLVRLQAGRKVMTRSVELIK